MRNIDFKGITVWCILFILVTALPLRYLSVNTIGNSALQNVNCNIIDEDTSTFVAIQKSIDCYNVVIISKSCGCLSRLNYTMSENQAVEFVNKIEELGIHRYKQNIRMGNNSVTFVVKGTRLGNMHMTFNLGDEEHKEEVDNIIECIKYTMYDRLIPLEITEYNPIYKVIMDKLLEGDSEILDNVPSEELDDVDIGVLDIIENLGFEADN